MNHFVLGVLYNIDFNENFKLKEEPNINIINDSTHINELIQDQNFLFSIGILEHDLLSVNKKHFSHFRFEDGSAIDENLLQLIAMQKYLTQTFLTALWLVKDNAVNTGNFYGWHLETGTVIGDYPKLLLSSSKGEYVSTSFTVEETNQAMEFQKEVIKYSSKNKDEVDVSNPIVGLEVSAMNNFNKRNTTFDDDRITRALKMSLIARSQSFLPAKISSYITAIEALVSSNRESLTMQVAERVPKIIGGSKEDKITIHDNLREAYNIRSKFVHGDKVSEKTVRMLDQVSENMDGILRKLIIKVIYEYEVIKDINEEAMTKWYKNNFMF